MPGPTLPPMWGLPSYQKSPKVYGPPKPPKVTVVPDRWATKPPKSGSVVSTNIPKTTNQAWDRYALDPEEVYWLTNKTLEDKRASSGLSNSNVQNTLNWMDINLRPQDRPSWTPGSTTGAPWSVPGSGSGGGGGWSGGGGGGGGGGEPVEVTWSEFGYKPEGAPSWWKALKPSEANPATEYLASLNMLIPNLSPEDQRTVAANLYQQDPKNFAHLNPESIGVNAPNQITPAMRQQYTSALRSSNALNALTQLASAMGKSDQDLGAGYRYLRSILNVGQQFGGQAGAQGMTRRNQLNAMGALDPLLSQAQGDQLGAYGSLARMLAQPYFSAGQLLPMQKTQDGRYLFGEANKELM